MRANEPEFFSAGVEVPHRLSQLGLVLFRLVEVEGLLLLLLLVVVVELQLLLVVMVQGPLSLLLDMVMVEVVVELQLLLVTVVQEPLYAGDGG